MTNETAQALSVSRDDATRFLENAVRNWSRVPPLSNDDLDDVAGALQQFAAQRITSTQSQPAATVQEANTHSTPGDAEVREAGDLKHKLWMIISHATGGELSNEADVDRSTNDICVRISAFRSKLYQAGKDAAVNALPDLLATPSGRAQGEWLPIETAPKDGTPFFAKGRDWGQADGRIHYNVAVWNAVSNEWRSWDEPEQALAYLVEWFPTAAPPAQDQTKGDE